MKIFHGINAFESEKSTCVTTGTFDGVHYGHLRIIDMLNDKARREGLQSVLVTFEPHPRKVLFPEDSGLRLLNTLEEKLGLLESTGLDALIVHPFTLEFSRLTALHYVRDLLVEKLNMKQLVIGYDHQFGKNREGSIEQLREYAPLFGFEVTEIPAQDIDNVKVSSTKVRKALADGDVNTAKLYLGYHYFLTGTVVAGKSRGKGLGFPTANIAVSSEDKVIPHGGVYAVTVETSGALYKGMLNIGYNPTFEKEGAPRTIEVHLFEFNGDLYGKEVRVNFHQRIRSEEKFNSVQELIEQMNDDREKALALLV